MPLAPGEKVRQKHLLGMGPPSPRKREVSQAGAAASLPEGRGAGAGRLFAGFEHGGGRSQGSGTSMETLVQNCLGHWSCP